MRAAILLRALRLMNDIIPAFEVTVPGSGPRSPL